MRKWTLIFALISLLAGVLDFTGMVAGSADIAKLMSVMFGMVCSSLLVGGLPPALFPVPFDDAVINRRLRRGRGRFLFFKFPSAKFFH